jgi:hypothetical protein
MLAICPGSARRTDSDWPRHAVLHAAIVAAVRIVVCLLTVSLIAAADVAVEIGPTAQPEQPVDEVTDSAEDRGERADELVIVPNPSYNPVFGAMLTVMGLYAYRPEGVTGRPWLAGAFAFGTQNGSWGAGAFHEARPGDDAWRIQAAAGYIDLRYGYYGSGEDSPLLDNPVELRQRVAAGGLTALKRLGDWTYLGPVLIWRDIRTSPDEPGPYGLELEQDIAGLGVKLLYDSRDEQFSPSRGVQAQARAMSEHMTTTDLGSVSFNDISYERFEASVNIYQLLASDTVLAARAATKWVSDNAPFFDQPFLGGGADLRGYAGEYRDRVLATTQVEVRRALPWRLGINAFAGVGAVAEDYDGLGDATARPSLGGSLTYLVAPVNRINARFDVAWGTEGWICYLSIGDAY